MGSESAGTVFLIGAGPGDPGLVTVKGRELLSSADAVVFDNLIPDELVVGLREGVEQIYVGKQAGHHTMSQDDINRLLVSLARQGKTVARLKGGDPFVFGRGGEEAAFLRENGVPYVVVPGVTAGVAGPAYCGIPATDREKASFVLFVTGHKAGEKDSTSVPWEWVAKANQGTIVIYMGVSEIANIVETLVGSGMSADTPAAAIERATLPSQRVFKARLSELPEVAVREKLRPPALVCIGEVVDLRAALDWFGGKPLFGLRVMVTRPADQARELYRRLRELGAEVLPYQTIATREFLDILAWRRCREISSPTKWLVFTSENGVRYFMKQFKGQMGDVRKLGGFSIAAVGSGTARALERFTLTADFIPTKATTADLARQMAAQVDLKDASVVRVQGNLSDDMVANALAGAGAEVIPLAVYNTYTPKWPEGFKERLLSDPPEVILFSSGSTVDGLRQHLTEIEVKQVAEKAVIVSIGPMTSKHVTASGVEVTIECADHSIGAMVEELLTYYEKNAFRRP
jgi:uroporphyrinogen III methyltransferase/synthase